MDVLWDEEYGLWNEPGTSGRRATIRSADRVGELVPVAGHVGGDQDHHCGASTFPG